MTVVPDDQTARIKALKQLQSPDTFADDRLNRLTKLASEICEAPIACVLTLDGRELSPRSSVGLDEPGYSETIKILKNAGMCGHTLRQNGLLVVPDVTADERFRDELARFDPLEIRTYMGMPLVAGDRERLGVLCVMYRKPTVIRDTWKDHLASLAEIVVDNLISQVILADAEQRAERSQDIIRIAGEWIWETDEHHRYTYHSDNGASRIFPSSQLIGRARWEFPGVDTELTQFDTMKEIFDRQEPFRDFEYYFVDRQGNHQHRKVSGNPVFAEDGSFQGYRGTSSNINQRVETIESLKAAAAAAEQANTAKSALIANISHELRTPLNAIIGFSDLILSAKPAVFSNPEHADYMSYIRNSGDDLLNIVDDIVDPSKTIAGDARLNETTVHIPSALQTCVQRLAFQAEAADLSMTVIYTDDLPLLLADERKLKQILINLLSNAIKFTPEGGMITLSADYTSTSGYILKVSDTGIGLSPDRFDEVLVPAQPSAPGGLQKFGDSGVGLPLAASYAELHGGTLKIVSEVGTGTTVEIRLPPERALQPESVPTDIALGLDEALHLISVEEYARSCLITNPQVPDNPIVYVTPEFERQTGYAKSEVLGRNCRFLQGPMSAPEAVAEIRQGIENATPTTVELVNYRKGGTPFRNRLSIRPVLGDHGEPAAFVAVQSIAELDELDMDDFAEHHGPDRP